MTPEDDRLAAEVIFTNKAGAIRAFLELATKYYSDLDRVDRTPRAIMVAHMLIMIETLDRYCHEDTVTDGNGGPPLLPKPS